MSRRPTEVMPALLTSTSIRCQRASTASTSRSRSAPRPTSAWQSRLSASPSRALGLLGGSLVAGVVDGDGVAGLGQRDADAAADAAAAAGDQGDGRVVHAPSLPPGAYRIKSRVVAGFSLRMRTLKGATTT